MEPRSIQAIHQPYTNLSYLTWINNGDGTDIRPSLSGFRMDINRIFGHLRPNIRYQTGYLSISNPAGYQIQYPAGCQTQYPAGCQTQYPALLDIRNPSQGRISDKFYKLYDLNK